MTALGGGPGVSEVVPSGETDRDGMGSTVSSSGGLIIAGASSLSALSSLDGSSSTGDASNVGIDSVSISSSCAPSSDGAAPGNATVIESVAIGVSRTVSTNSSDSGAKD